MTEATVTLPCFALEEFLKLARSRRRAHMDLANSPLAGQKRHAEKRRAEANAWDAVAVALDLALRDATDEVAP